MFKYAKRVIVGGLIAAAAFSDGCRSSPPPSGEISPIVRQLDSEQTLEQAISINTIFSNLVIEAERDVRAGNFEDRNFFPPELAKQYHDEVDKRIDAISYDGEPSAEVRHQIEQEVLKDNPELMQFMGGSGRISLEAILNILMPCATEVFPGKKIDINGIGFANFNGGGLYSNGAALFSGQNSIDLPVSWYYYGVAHESAHSIEIKYSTNETITDARTYNILACEAKKGDAMAGLALFAHLQGGAWLYALQNARSEKNFTAMNTAASEFDRLKNEKDIAYSLNPFGYVLEAIVHGKTKFDWGSLDVAAEYVGSKYQAEALRQLQRNAIISRLPNLENIALTRHAPASSSLIEGTETGFWQGDDAWVMDAYHSVAYKPNFPVQPDISNGRGWKPAPGHNNGSAWWMVDMGGNNGYNVLRILPDNGFEFFEKFRIETSGTCEFNGEQKVVVSSPGDYSSFQKLYAEKPQDLGSALLLPITPTTDRCIRVSADEIRGGGIQKFEAYNVP